MKCRNQGKILACLEKINVNDLGVRWVKASSGINRVLDFDLPFHPRLKSSGKPRC